MLHSIIMIGAWNVRGMNSLSKRKEIRSSDVRATQFIHVLVKDQQNDFKTVLEMEDRIHGWMVTDTEVADYKLYSEVAELQNINYHGNRAGLSDHAYAIIAIRNEPPAVKKPFKFFNLYYVDLGSIFLLHSRGVMEEKDKRGTILYQLVQEMKLLEVAPKASNKQYFSDVSQQVAQARDLLAVKQEHLRQNCTDPTFIDEEREAKSSIVETLTAEACFYKQKLWWIGC
ncbi:hypothetical protein Ancab_015274 [Ancistrocladus abbreviatus]